MNSAHQPRAPRRTTLHYGILYGVLSGVPSGVPYGVLFSFLIMVSSTSSAMPATQSADGERELSFFHTHTGERLDIVYFRQGKYAEKALTNVNFFLRDFRTGDVAAIDRNTLDIVYELKRQLNYQGDVHIVSAYRSPKTNEMLRKKGSGVAKKSQHLEGKAIDFRLPGVDTAKLRDLAKAMRRGGVGYYHDSDFIHVDSGRVRYW